MSDSDSPASTEQNGKLLTTLQRLLAIQAIALKSALDEASTLICSAVNADKADTFLLEPATQCLVAAGTSQTPMGRHQRRLASTGGGRLEAESAIGQGATFRLILPTGMEGAATAQ